jgi:hypothetical protein
MRKVHKGNKKDKPDWPKYRRIKKSVGRTASSCNRKKMLDMNQVTILVHTLELIAINVQFPQPDKAGAPVRYANVQ